MNYVYIKSEPQLWTVGFYRPESEPTKYGGLWEPESDHDNREDAAKRVHYLNGGNDKEIEDKLNYLIDAISSALLEYDQTDWIDPSRIEEINQILLS